MNNVKCYDNGGETCDRYTVVYLDYPTRDGLFNGVGCSENPFHPQGFGQHIECEYGSHLGNKISFSSLPKDVQTLVKNDHK